jgi:hypothetical protein
MKKLDVKGLIAGFPNGRVQLNDGTVIDDEALIKKALDAIDQDAIVEKLKKEFKAEEWDRKTAINSVPAAHVLMARRDIPAHGKVYIISRGDRVLFFQPFKPGLPGRQTMETEAELRTCMNEHRDQIITSQALMEAKLAVMIKLQTMR